MNWRVGGSSGAQRSTSQLRRTNSLSPACRKNGPSDGPNRRPATLSQPPSRARPRPAGQESLGPGAEIGEA